MTEHVHRVYFADRAGYWLNCVDKRTDNADQRIAEDIDAFTVFAGQFFFGNYAIPGSIVFVLATLLCSVAFIASQARARAAACTLVLLDTGWCTLFVTRVCVAVTV